MRNSIPENYKYLFSSIFGCVHVHIQFLGEKKWTIILFHQSLIKI